jgi:hypothetical protein
LGPKTAKALKMSTFPDIVNALYGAALEHPEIATDGGDPGREAIQETAELILGIPIDYYVVVNMLGLADLVDAFGGVDPHHAGSTGHPQEPGPVAGRPPSVCGSRIGRLLRGGQVGVGIAPSAQQAAEE